MTNDLVFDAYRYRRTTRRSVALRLFFSHRTFRVIATLRWCQNTRGPIQLVGKFVHRLACSVAGIDIPSKTRIGPGFAIHHGWGIVVNHAAVIGRNVTLMQGVTIGQADQIAPDGSRTTTYPVIGDNVWIGPHAVIVGGVTIGNGARILAGAIVTGDIPPATMVGGNPARVIRTNVPRDVVNPIEDATQH